MAESLSQIGKARHSQQIFGSLTISADPADSLEHVKRGFRVVYGSISFRISAQVRPQTPKNAYETRVSVKVRNPFSFGLRGQVIR